MVKSKNHQRSGINARPPNKPISELLAMVGCVVVFKGLGQDDTKLICIGLGVSLTMAGAPAIARWFGRFL